jgi:hypothetical protein
VLLRKRHERPPTFHISTVSSFFRDMVSTATINTLELRKPIGPSALGIWITGTQSDGLGWYNDAPSVLRFPPKGALFGNFANRSRATLQKRRASQDRYQ